MNAPLLGPAHRRVSDFVGVEVDFLDLPVLETVAAARGVTVIERGARLDDGGAALATCMVRLADAPGVTVALGSGEGPGPAAAMIDAIDAALAERAFAPVARFLRRAGLAATWVPDTDREWGRFVVEEPPGLSPVASDYAALRAPGPLGRLAAHLLVGAGLGGDFDGGRWRVPETPLVGAGAARGVRSPQAGLWEPRRRSLRVGPALDEAVSRALGEPPGYPWSTDDCLIRPMMKACFGRFPGSDVVVEESADGAWAWGSGPSGTPVFGDGATRAEALSRCVLAMAARWPAWQARSDIGERGIWAETRTHRGRVYAAVDVPGGEGLAVMAFASMDSPWAAAAEAARALAEAGWVETPPGGGGWRHGARRRAAARPGRGDEVRLGLARLRRLVLTRPATPAPEVAVADDGYDQGWGGAGIAFVTRAPPPPPVSKEWDFRYPPRYVVTPHAFPVGWLIALLQPLLGAWGHAGNKYVFFASLGDGIDRALAADPVASERVTLLALLDAAEALLVGQPLEAW